MENSSAPALSREELIARLRQHLGEEREAQVAFLIALEELDRRGEWRALGHATLWAFLRGEFGLLDGTIYRRITAITLMRKAPLVVEFLRDGRLNTTTLALLKDVLTSENAGTLLSNTAGKSVRDVEELVAAMRFPAPVDCSDRMRRLPSSAMAHDPPLPSERREDATGPAPPAANSASAASPAPPPHAREQTADLHAASAERWKIALVVDREFVELLDRATEILSHVVADGSRVEVVRRALSEVVRREEKRSTPKEGDDETASAAARGRVHVPAAVERQVRARDGGRCAWKKADGSVCGSRWKVEIDHVVPVAKGGMTSVANCRLLCRAHNVQHAVEQFGAETMARFG